jgi:membrane protease YdiL (CAAX protease family)
MSFQAEPTNTPEIPPSTPPPPPSLGSRIFFGSEGLRSGWSFALYLVMCAVMVFIMQPLVRHLARPLRLTAWSTLVGYVFIVTVVFVAALLLGAIEKRPFSAYGLPPASAFGKTFWQGVIWGIAALTVLLLVLRGSHAFYFGSPVEHGLRAFKFAAFWALVMLLVGFVEEFLFRGPTLYSLSRGIGFWWSALALSLLFGAVHLNNTGENPAGALAAACIGFFFCFTLRRTGNLWFAVGFHASWNWGESYLYGVADSGNVAPGHLLGSSFHGPAWLTGGTVGPEGSALVFILIALLFVAFHYLHPPRNAAA